MNKRQVQNFLKQHNLQPIKKFGQNFLINPNVIQIIVNQIQKLPPPWIEVGPGLGALSRHFENKKSDIILIERDKKLAHYWKKNNWNIINADVLKLNWKELPTTFSLFGNLPYQIAGSLILKSCLQQKQISHMILTMQKEVAQRVTASPQSKNYGLLSVMSQVFWNINTVIDIPKSDFYPIPKVEGRVLKFQNKYPNLKADSFLQFVKQCFSFKRKMLFKQLPNCSFEMAKQMLKQMKLNENCRAEELKVSDFVQLYFKLK